MSQAGTVTKNSDRKVILDFEGEDVPAPNDRVFVLDQSTHKEIGLVEIIKTKGSRALGKLLKGAAKPGDTTDLAKKAKKQEDRVPADEDTNVVSEPRTEERRTTSRMSFGAGADFVYTSIFLKNDVGEGGATGNGFALRGYIDASLGSDWAILGSLGLHPVNAQTSTQSGAVSFEYKNNTNYLAMEGVARYLLDKRQQGLWIGGGLGYFIPMSSNIDPKPSSELALVGSAGFNVKVSRRYFSLKGDFVMFTPKSESGTSAQGMQFILGGAYFF
jgi:hypothetical protein